MILARTLNNKPVNIATSVFKPCSLNLFFLLSTNRRDFSSISTTLLYSPFVLQPKYKLLNHSATFCNKNIVRFASLHPLTRASKFVKLSKDHVKRFVALLSPQQVYATKEYGGSCDIQDLAHYNTDFYKSNIGSSSVVLFPKNTAQVSNILAFCNQQKIAVVPQGGNTGVVGASTVLFDEVIISMSKFNKIRSIDLDSGALICDAGCVLQDLDHYVSQFGLIMPLDLGAKGSCHIGGNISTNAGGIRYLRYGSLHGSVLGLEVVLPDGQILNNLSTLRKDSTGYDLKQIFIGAEGTLGIVTGVSIQTAQRPMHTNVAILGFNSFDDARGTLALAKTHLSEILSAFEFWDDISMNITLDHFKFKNPLSDPYAFYALIETGGSNNTHDQEKIIAFLEHSMDKGFVKDGTLARDKTQATEAIRKFGVLHGYDISIPTSKFYDIVNDVRKRLEDAKVFTNATNGQITANKVDVIVGYGHIGDGNIHLNLMLKTIDSKVIQLLEPYIYEWVSTVSGSISAEHGLGLVKKDYLKYSKSPEIIQLMKKIKKIYDPNEIMNPYKFLPN
ncbi:hypothetical protein BB561_001750 [Smittium simulii]|uniref:FAD-binding PCMH-type domain-containing protein n=1 Tax=Smittium simulii TaxID=133385 RepID=A0A2T9YT65_9FUNG|nr:hypothetical protein BB561_001750 [Smittium simulii]